MTLNTKDQFLVLADLAEEHNFDREVIEAVRKLGKTEGNPGKWFCFNQNNSGGSFEGVRFVLIEATDADHANQRAEDETDIYFDGCYNGSDCPCCGDRWSRVDDYEGTDEPEIYGKPVEEGIQEAYNADTATYQLFPLD